MNQPMVFVPGLRALGTPKIEMHGPLQILFTARPPLQYLTPMAKQKCRKIDGFFLGYRDYTELFEENEPPERVKVELPHEKKQRIAKEKLEQHKQKVKEEIKKWVPKEDLKATEDPKKTLFVGRLNYETNEKKLKKEFEIYGPIKSIRIVRDANTEKSKGYAFIEYEDLEDFKNAYKKADGRKIDGRRVVVDFERGRTIRGWRPRRFGGGLGSTRRTVTQQASNGDNERQESTERPRSRNESKENKQDNVKEKEKSPQKDKDKKKSDKSKDKKRDKNLNNDIHTNGNDLLEKGEIAQDKDDYEKDDKRKSKKKKKDRDRERTRSKSASKEKKKKEKRRHYDYE